MTKEIYSDNILVGKAIRGKVEKMDDIIANVIILLVLPVLGLFAAFADERETLFAGFAIFGVFLICALLVML